MKMISMILGVLALALFAFVGVGLYKAADLRTIRIVKTVTIQSSIEDVFGMVKYLNNFPKWSPFLAQDPSQQYKVVGVDGTPGAQYHWEGNGGKDLGYQEIVKIEENRFVAMKCDIKKPFEAKPTFEYYFTETADGIEVEQVFKLESKRIEAFFMWLFRAKKEMESTNQQGLNLLKKATEQ